MPNPEGFQDDIEMKDTAVATPEADETLEIELDLGDTAESALELLDQ